MLYLKLYVYMNNSNLNKARFSIIFGFFFMSIIIIIMKENGLKNIYILFAEITVAIFIILYINYFYDPYNHIRFGRDDNIENIFYYFFILDNDKNKNFLIEEKIEFHFENCGICGLCNRYKNPYLENKNKQINIYNIISNNLNPIFNLMNKIIRDIKRNGKQSFVNNSYFLVNLMYVYSMGINQGDENLVSNTELIYNTINSENSIFFEEYNNSLQSIKYTNNFIKKAKDILNLLNEIFVEKNFERKVKLFFKLGRNLENFKFRERKSIYTSNNNGYEYIPNCNNLLTICTSFYEELFNEVV